MKVGDRGGGGGGGGGGGSLDPFGINFLQKAQP